MMSTFSIGPNKVNLKKNKSETFAEKLGTFITLSAGMQRVSPPENWKQLFFFIPDQNTSVGN